MRMNQDSMVFILETIYLKNTGRGIRNKPWWICRCRHTLDCYILQQKWNCLFDSFGVEHFPEEMKEFIWNKDITANIFWVQADNSIICGYFCIGFIDFMLAGKKMTDFSNMFSPYDFKKNGNIILSYFKDEWN